MPTSAPILPLHRARLAEAEREAIQRALDAETLATRKKDEFIGRPRRSAVRGRSPLRILPRT